MPVDRLFSELSIWTWHFLRDAPFRPREETITETLLTELARQAAGTVWIQKSTIPEEATFGLDWASAIHTRAGWLVSVVQAKNADGDRWGVYPGLRTPDAALQARRLIHFSALAQAVPLYAFYNHEVPPFGSVGSFADFGACGRGRLRREADDFPWLAGRSPMGVSLAHAEDVLENAIPPPSQNQRASEILTYSMPWECLFCPRSSLVDAPEDDDGWLSRLARVRCELGARLETATSEEPLQNSGSPPIWLHQQAPDWAEMVREGEALPLSDTEAPPARFLLVIDADDSQ